MLMKRFLAGLLLYLFAAVPAHATISCALPFTLTNGTLADATQVMANYNALVNCFTQAASAGSNSDITALNGLVTPITPGQGGTNVFIGGTSTGSANVQTLASTTPNTFVLTAGYRAVFIAGFTNTGATTLNIHSTGAVNVFRLTPLGPVALVGNEIVAGQLVEVVYDGTQYEILSVVPGLTGGYGPLTAISSAATTDLGTVTTHNAQVTGVAAITSFGSSASTTFPIYRLQFSSAATLTHNATTLILPGTANIITAQNDTAVAMYLGAGNWQVISYNKANGAAVVSAAPLCGANGFTLTNNAGTPNTNFDYAADSAVLINPTGNVPIYGTTISGTLNATNGTVTSTVDGMDGEARPTSAWGFFYLISNGTTFGGLLATSATSPTMPAGYTYRCRVGAISFDASQNSFRFTQNGAVWQYKLTVTTNTTIPILLAQNATGSTFGLITPTLVAIQVTGNTKCAPTTATDVYVSVSSSYKGTQGASVMVAPGTTGWSGANNGPQGTAGNVFPLLIDSSQPNVATTNQNQTAWIHLESNSIGYAGSASNGAAATCLGYRDKVNAN